MDSQIKTLLGGILGAAAGLSLGAILILFVGEPLWKKFGQNKSQGNTCEASNCPHHGSKPPASQLPR